MFSVAPKQVMGEMVLDGGGRFSPAGIFGVHTLSLLLSSQAAHKRATVDSHTHALERTIALVDQYTRKSRYSDRGMLRRSRCALIFLLN